MNDHQPAHGFTPSGRPVYGHTRQYLPALFRLSPHQLKHDLGQMDSFNAKVALLLTRLVGTMWCFYVFNGIALISLPAAIQSGNMTILIAWISSNWIQLILLPAIMVGQSLQSTAADARAEKTFADVESILDRLDTKTQGGLKDILDAVEAIKG